MRPLHICHVMLSLEPGGLENGVVNVVNGLDRDRFRSSICCLRRTGAFAARVRSDVAIESMNTQGGNSPRTVLRLAKLFRSWGVDIVHTRNAEPFFFGVLGARLSGVPAVIHSEHGRTFPGRRLRAAAQRILLSQVDAAFAVSNRLRLDLVHELRLPPDRFEVISNGVDITAFRNNSTLTDDHRQNRPVCIGSVGRLVPVKNYPLLLEAISRISKERSIKLILVGDGPERGRLTDMAEKLGIRHLVEFAGHRDDVHSLLRTFDIFVLPSLSEGMSNTLLEAMAAEVAVLASDVGGNIEIIEPECSGLVFRSGDVDHAVSQLSRLVENTSMRLSLARSGRRRVYEDFSVESMLNRYEALYGRVWKEVRHEP